MRMDVEITLQDFQDAVLLHQGATQPTGLLPKILLGLVCAAGGVWSIYGSRWQASFPVGYFLLSLAVFVPLTSLLSRRRQRLSYQQAKRQLTGMRYEWDEQGLSVRGADRIHWDEFVKTRENDRVYVVYNTDQTFLIFPKRDSRNLALIDDIKTHLIKAQQSTDRLEVK